MIKIHWILLVAIVSIFFSSCAPAYKMRGTFNPEDHEPFLGDGSSSISGQAFLKTRGGDVKYAAGNQIFLIPATAYTNEMFTAGATRRVDPSSFDYRLRNYTKITVGDGEGRFSFANIKAGNYYVLTTITWAAGRYAQTGGDVFQYVTVEDGENKNIILTR
jgi:hypothetical protein